MSKRIESIYEKAGFLVGSLISSVKPHLRMALRFLALPYCFFFLVNWEECKKAKIKVGLDLLYIFFVLKYYPYNYSLCRLWEKDRSEWRFYYGSIYEPYQRAKLSREVQKEEYKIIFDDKEVCYLMCQSLVLPLPDQLGVLDPDADYAADLKKMLQQNIEKTLIIKPVRGAGGKDIFLAYNEKNDFKIKTNNRIFKLENFVLEHRCVVQIYLDQHPELCLFSNSLNTIRIVTLLTKKNEVIILGAYMRFGRGDKYVDNLSSGGIAVGIDMTRGALMDSAHDSKSKVYKTFPETNIEFSGLIVPFWKDVVSLAKRVQMEFGFYKLLGIDIGITSKGPVIVEINPSHDNIGLEQKVGPLLKNDHIQKVFQDYDLLL